MSDVKGLILAAGFGSRLMPLTEDRPKAMVEIFGRPMIQRQVDTMRECNINDISVVAGYQYEKLQSLNLPLVINKDYDSTNMVWSMMCAREIFDGSADVIMSYGDIVYEKRVLEELINTEGNVVVAADSQWKRLWGERMDNVLDDVETFKVDASGKLYELGKKPQTMDDIQGQYMGLVKFSSKCHEALLKFYDSLDDSIEYDGKSFRQMYMTSFIQGLKDSGWVIDIAWTESGWLEVDTVDDIEIYERMHLTGQLDPVYRLSV